MAECMGLHRDGETYGLTPLETHVRRLVWHQLCFLDIRTCEAQGPKPAIRREDYDTKLPINCNEEELVATAGAPPPEPSDAWTTNTLSLIRFEINEMMRAVWVDRRRLETRRITLTAVLTKIESFRRRMSEKYDRLLDISVPIQRYAKCVINLLTCRLHIMVLHPYYANASNPMPPRLSHLLITSGIMVIELAIQLETNPVFQDWAWYLGAYFQYQIAILLATEVYFRPQNSEADRIWSCLDYVFGLDRKMPSEAKCTHLLSEISNRTAVYMRRRKMRGPTTTAQAMVAANAVAGTNPSLSGRSQQHQAGQQQPVELPHQQQQQRQDQLQHQHPAAGMGHMPPGGGGAGNARAKIEQGYAPSQMRSELSAIPPHPQMVFAGVSDGQVLWSLPPNTESPQSSDSSSLAAPHARRATGTVSTAPTPVPALTSVLAPVSMSSGSASAEARAGSGAGAGAGTAPDPNVPQGNIMDSIDWVSHYLVSI